MGDNIGFHGKVQHLINLPPVLLRYCIMLATGLMADSFSNPCML